MKAGRVHLFTFAVVAISIGLAAATSEAQDQNPSPTVRDYCIKIAPGKGAEYEAYLRDVAVPLNQSRADSGDFAWYLVMRAVSPAGSSAPCDYRVVFGYEGLPPEGLSREGLDAALKRAKLPLTADQLIAKRRAFSSLVAAEIWSQIDGIGPNVEKGGYVRLNHYKATNSDWADWVRMETTYWKPIMEAWLKDGGVGGWGLYGLWMPGGDSTPYSGATVDTFPSWDALIQGIPLNELWTKVHPGTTPTDTFNRFDKVRSIHSIEYYKVVAVVSGT